MQGRPAGCGQVGSGTRTHVRSGRKASTGDFPPVASSIAGQRSAGMPRFRHAKADGALTPVMRATATGPPRSSIVMGDMEATLAFTKVIAQVNACLVAAKFGRMGEDQLQQHRRERLQAWLDDHGGLAKVVESRSLKVSYQGYLSAVTNGYSFGGRAARKCEDRLGMPSGWLDVTAAAAVPEKADVSSSMRLAEALPVVLEALLAAPASTRSELAQVLGLLVTTGAAPYRQRVLDILEGPSDKRRAA